MWLTNAEVVFRLLSGDRMTFLSTAMGLEE
jgi:hypothetical protein